MIRSTTKQLLFHQNYLKNNLLKQFLLSTNDFSAAAKKADESPNEEIERCYRNLGDLSFENTQEAFKSKSNWELWRAALVLKLCSYDVLVNQNVRLMHLGKKLLGQRMFEKLMRATVYGHFVAGKDQEEIKPVVQKMRAFGVKSILDYSVEADIAETPVAECKLTQGRNFCKSIVEKLLILIQMLKNY